MPQMIDHPEAFSKVVAGALVFMVVSFSDALRGVLYSDEATAICSQGNKPVALITPSSGVKIGGSPREE
jgi:hypothetical protein